MNKPLLIIPETTEFHNLKNKFNYGTYLLRGYDPRLCLPGDVLAYDAFYPEFLLDAYNIKIFYEEDKKKETLYGDYYYHYLGKPTSKVSNLESEINNVFVIKLLEKYDNPDFLKKFFSCQSVIWGRPLTSLVKLGASLLKIQSTNQNEKEREKFIGVSEYLTNQFIELSEDDRVLPSFELITLSVSNEADIIKKFNLKSKFFYSSENKSIRDEFETNIIKSYFELVLNFIHQSKRLKRTEYVGVQSKIIDYLSQNFRVFYNWIKPRYRVEFPFNKYLTTREIQYFFYGLTNLLYHPKELGIESIIKLIIQTSKVNSNFIQIKGDFSRPPEKGIEFTQLIRRFVKSKVGIVLNPRL